MPDLPFFEILFFVVLSYLIGSFPTAFVIVKIFTGKNVMQSGTNNVGTMNTHRTTNNKFLTGLVLLGDLAKGALVYFLSLFLIQNFNSILDSIFYTNLIFGFGLTALILGHNYSIFLKFKGGKGLASAAGFLLLLNPFYVFTWVLGFLLTTITTKYMVLGQMAGTVVLPIFVAITDFDKLIIVLLPSILIFLAHAPRIKNVLNGSEPEMYYKIRKTKEN
jgi:glycerol-3-phosphate acyltransferase PlsY